MITDTGVLIEMK